MWYKLVRQEFEEDKVIISMPDGALAVSMYHSTRPTEDIGTFWAVRPTIIVEYLAPIGQDDT